MDIAREILRKEQRELEKFKSIQVQKHLDVRTDLGLLMSADPNDFDEKQLRYFAFISMKLLMYIHMLDVYRENTEGYLLELTRGNVQLLLNEIWELPTERVGECVVAKLPQQTCVLPRSRKCPVAKPLTKWEKFAKEKGIKKVKKDKKVFDADLNVSSISIIPFTCFIKEFVCI